MIRVEMLATGDEILHGQIIDTNAAWLSELLFEEGLPMTSRMTVGDNLPELIAALSQRSQIADVLIVNGGLGPTSDDLSSQAAAIAAGVKLKLEPEWLAKMETRFAMRGRIMAPCNRKQAEIPEGAEILDNPAGTACGFAMQLNCCWLYFTPGVPAEFKTMVQQQVIPHINAHFLLPQPLLCLRLTTFGCSESLLAAKLNDITLPQGVVTGYRAAMPVIELKLTGPEQKRVDMQAIWQQIREIVGDHLIFEGKETLAQQLARCLRERGLSLSVSERYTGGLLNWHLALAAAPLVTGEVQPPPSETLDELAVSGKTADITLIVGDCQADGSIAFALRTPGNIFAQRLQLNLQNYSLSIRQQTVAIAAMNMLRRWLNGKSVTGSFGWVEALETREFTL